MCLFMKSLRLPERSSGTTEIGDEIPGPLFLAVARVLAYVFHLRQSAPTDYIPRPDPVDLPGELPEYLQELNEHG